jgi:hypothetical protein
MGEFCDIRVVQCPIWDRICRIGHLIQSYPGRNIHESVSKLVQGRMTIEKFEARGD